MLSKKNRIFVFISLLLIALALSFHFVSGELNAIGVPSILIMIFAWLIFSQFKKSSRENIIASDTVDIPPMILQAEKKTNNDVDKVDLSVLGADYKIEQLKRTEEKIDGIISNAIKLIKAHLSAHTIAVLFPAAGGGYQIRGYMSQCENIDKDVIIYPGKGIVGCFLKDGLQRLNLHDIVTDSTTLQYYTKDVGIKSLIATPIMTDGIERGVILADSKEKDHFNDENIAYLGAVTQMCGQAIYNAYLYNEHKINHVRLVAMSSIEKFFFKKHDLDSVFDKMTELIPFTFSCHRMTISLREPDSNEAVIKRAWGKNTEGLQDLVFSLDEKSLASVIYDKNISMYRNFASDRYEVRYNKSEPQVNTFASFLAFPIGVEKCKGLIFLESEQRDAFSNSSRELLSRLVTSAGIAIEKIQILKRTESMATHDGLTGLYNHRQFQHLLKEAITRSIRYNDPLALIICDIDYFKKVNDTYGHRFGDTVLKEISAILHNSIRADIDVSARYGGEEFALVLEKTDAEQVMEKAEKIRSLVEEHKFQSPAGKELTITMSFGAAIYGLHAKNQEQLIQRADKALYLAKDNGRNRAELYYNSVL